MLSRINVIKIVRDHFLTLRSINSSSRNMSRGDFIVFIATPIILSSLLTIKKIGLSDHLTDLITAVSIIGGFLFNFLAIIYGLMDKLQLDSQNDVLRKRFVQEIHVNISFNILVSFVLIILLISYSFESAEKKCWDTYDNVFNSIIYFFLFNFILTMVMILNRVYIIMKKEVNLD